MGFRCGIVGLPNVGKSTLFNTLTNAGAEAANYPFCTIDPNIGQVTVPDTRLAPLAKLVNPQKTVPATMQFVDIAGLVAGASQGEGLGNQFLAHIRETDAIAQVVRCFEDENIIHVDGVVNPLSDIETIETELMLADLDTLARAATRIQRAAKSGDKTLKAQLDVLDALKRHLEAEQPARAFDIPDPQLAFIESLTLLTQKPIVYIANVSEDGFEQNPHLDAVRAHAKKVGAEVVPICALIESELADMTPEEQTEFLTELGLEEPGLNRVIRAGYQLLKLQTFFTAGEKELRAWTIPIGATAPQAAGKIHTDFEKGFIRAEVIAFDDYIAHAGEAGAKDAGCWRLEGKDYVMVDGDVVLFRFNV